MGTGPGVVDAPGVPGRSGVVPGSVGAMAVLPVASTGVGGRDGGFVDVTGLESLATVVGAAGRAARLTAAFGRVFGAAGSVRALGDVACRLVRPSLISLAYASRFRPRGVVRPASQDRTVARVTPTTVATCSSLSDFASRSLRRSSGEGSGWGEAISVGPCVMKDPPQGCTG
ncbi:hypothetical protein GCM10015535_30010 [Streptomyces gelaticus]|uniref:Uncharacterized protein n=1 Tax=Streptomyces gelaticus TaxID=285446 RepID=A0ABQ2VY45_9ACTN|nr:hypothetical protein GCM10015535_30010 [Streptomyces gelaticus]